MNSKALFPELAKVVEQVEKVQIPLDRKAVLQPLIDYIQEKTARDQEVHLNFICTHNSRRSQFSQLWAHLAAYYYGIPAHCYSGGVEVTAFNERAVASIQRFGFSVEGTTDVNNPIYLVQHHEDIAPLRMFSKLFDDPENKAPAFAAVMTCAHADENCPFVPGTEQRIAVRYQDPKAFDDTPEEASRYDQRSMQIASEMFYVFAQIKLN